MAALRRMSIALLRRLEILAHEFGHGPAAAKLELLRRLERRSLASAGAVARLHELLCFLRAYPDDSAVLRQVRAMLLGFAARRDLRRHGAALADSGIAGTAIRYSFFAATAARLARRWPDRLHVVWDEFDRSDDLEPMLQLFVLWGETPGLDEAPLDLRQWVDLLRGKLADGAFVVRSIQASHPDPFVFEHAFERLELPLRLEPGPDTPSRTLAEAPVQRVHFQRGPLRTARPTLPQAIHDQPRAVRALDRKAGERYVELARDAMVTRQRDLDAFAYGDPDDVRLVDWEDGLQFAAIGVRPERRLQFEAVYAFLTLKNGAPTGYVLNSALFGSAEVAYNVFEAFRGSEAGHVYGRVLATVHHLFGVDSFTIYPYQLGDDNDEALQSGAFWFYQKLGFRPRERGPLRLMARELARMRRDPRHRSTIPTLRRLAAANVYYHMGRQRSDVIGLLPLGNVGLSVSRSIARRYGGDRERAEADCALRAARLLGLGARERWSAAERLWFRRWAPLVAVLPGVMRWPVADRIALLEVIRKKGGRRESDFVRAFDGHARLRAAIRHLAGAR